MWRRHRRIPEFEVRIIIGLSPTEPAAIQKAHGSQQVTIPTDLFVTAWRQLFPAERMLVFGGRRTVEGINITSVVDVTEAEPSTVHVKSCPVKLSRTLIDFERTGAHLAVWMHSHPGEGVMSTHPSSIDTKQDADLRKHYSDGLLNIIAVRDGCLRLWGEALENGLVSVRWDGKGVEPCERQANVYRLTLS
jgi:hypothetical protein